MTIARAGVTDFLANIAGAAIAATNMAIVYLSKRIKIAK
jgi:hypothetical protein